MYISYQILPYQILFSDDEVTLDISVKYENIRHVTGQNMVKTSIFYRAWLRITCKLVMSSERPCHKRIRNLLSYCIKDKKAKTTGL